MIDWLIDCDVDLLDLIIQIKLDQAQIQDMNVLDVGVVYLCLYWVPDAVQDLIN